MNLRFSDYTVVGEVNLTPDSVGSAVGAFSLDEGHDTIWIRVTQLNGDGPWPFSYGILSWKTSQGYELGSVKAYGETDSEVFRIGVGRPPLLRTGFITFEPRSFNLAWIKKGYNWRLKFEASSGQSGSGQSPSDPVPGNGATLGSFADFDDTRVSFAFIKLDQIS